MYVPVCSFSLDINANAHPPKTCLPLRALISQRAQARLPPQHMQYQRESFQLRDPLGH